LRGRSPRQSQEFPRFNSGQGFVVSLLAMTLYLMRLY
jgi:hypothetical protein